MNKTVAITGASGYLGSALVDFLLSRGWKVVALTGNACMEEREGLIVRQFRLGQAFPADLSCEALIHAAYDFRPAVWGDIERVNVAGSIELFSSALAASIRCIFISSQSAAAAQSMYGLGKREVEAYCLGHGIEVVRPGLITGPGGLYGKLSGLVTHFRVIPLIGRGNQVLYLVRREDLCAVIEQILNGRLVVKSPIEIAYPHPFTFREIFYRLAQMYRRQIVFAPVPIFIVRIGLRLASRLGLQFGFREDNLNGLLGQSLRPSIGELGVPLQDPIV